MNGKFSEDHYRIETETVGNVDVHVQHLAISPEPDHLASLGDWDPDLGTTPMAHYSDELIRAEKNAPGTIGDDGCVPVHWSIIMEDNGGWMSPFSEGPFDTFYDQGFTHPINVRTDQPLDWHSLPIVHRFPEFWEELGFNPAPFAPRFEVIHAVLARRGD